MLWDEFRWMRVGYATVILEVYTEEACRLHGISVRTLIYIEVKIAT